MQSPVLDSPPLFTLAHAMPSPVDFVKMYKFWPNEKKQLLTSAQAIRDTLIQHMKLETALKLRIEDIDKYFPILLAIEQEKRQNPKIEASQDQKLRFHWKQSPIVIDKYLDRYFTGNYVSIEVLQILWLKANLLMNDAFLLEQNDNGEQAIKQYREIAGIFQYLASDRLRVQGVEAAPIEFQPAMFHALTSVNLAQAYVLIAQKGEREATTPSVMAKLCFTVSTMYGSAYDGLKETKDKDTFHPQFLAWLEGAKLYYNACACILMAKSVKSKDQYGKSVGLLRCAISQLNNVLTLNKKNLSLINGSKKLIETFSPLEKSFTQENCSIYNEPVPNETDALQLIAQMCTIMQNLPQPTPFTLPTPAE